MCKGSSYMHHENMVFCYADSLHSLKRKLQGPWLQELKKSAPYVVETLFVISAWQNMLTMMSPTSILDSKLFSVFRNPFTYTMSPSNPQNPNLDATETNWKQIFDLRCNEGRAVARPWNKTWWCSYAEFLCATGPARSAGSGQQNQQPLEACFQFLMTMGGMPLRDAATGQPIPISSLASTHANVASDQQGTMLGESLYPLLDQ
ncbi:hypothetical protein CK203_029983 [Vitis vinifera]|uniref:Uncharacterized protein n=1 Tax=Vitis vinifera TaxID=29760 RepID=A0A438IK45_VITVI|nr:hypothetical protein CK203_029983 [Vitis vinifera]